MSRTRSVRPFVYKGDVIPLATSDGPMEGTAYGFVIADDGTISVLVRIDGTDEYFLTTDLTWGGDPE